MSDETEPAAPESPKPCGFCNDKPVANARSWIALNEPRYSPCPRCGKTWDDNAVAEQALMTDAESL